MRSHAQRTYSIGFTELKDASEVDTNIPTANGTSLLMLNSVCGCAAGAARPGVKLALSKTESKPDHLITVFAGQDIEATVQVRKYLAPYPPSSPCIALFKDGKEGGAPCSNVIILKDIRQR